MRSSMAALVLAASLGALASTGCISEHTYGCENTTVVAAGSQEGDIYSYHGCPDQVIEIGNKVGPNIKSWNKYLVVYRIAYGHKLLGTIVQEDRFSNIAYLVENGRVVNGGYVGEGFGTAYLGALSGAMHNRVRAGYGGDDGWDGSYGQSGRRGVAVKAENERDHYYQSEGRR